MPKNGRVNQMIFLTRIDGYAKLVPTDQMGRLCTKEHIKELIHVLTIYTNEFPEDRIRLENENFRKEYFPQEFNLLPGYVYLMKVPGGNCKIGMSDNPNRRLKQISRKHPGVYLLHTVSADHMEQAEIALQDKYLKSHVKGEWFDLSCHDIIDIQDIKAYKDGQFI